MDFKYNDAKTIRKMIEEIRAKDPKLTYTREQIEQRRRKRISMGLAFATPASSVNNHAVSAPTGDLASRSPRPQGFRLNTEFFRTSIDLLKEKKDMPKQPYLQGNRQELQAIEPEKQEPEKLIEHKVENGSSQNANLNQISQSNQSSSFMQLNPVVQEGTATIPSPKPLEQERPQKVEISLFQSSVPVKEQLGLALAEGSTVPAPPSSFFPLKGSLFEPMIQGASTSLFAAKKIQENQEPSLSSMNEKPQNTPTGLFSSSLFSCTPVPPKQEKKQPTPSLFGGPLFGTTKPLTFEPKPQGTGGLFEQPQQKGKLFKKDMKETQTTDRQEIAPAKKIRSEEQAKPSKNIFGAIQGVGTVTKEEKRSLTQQPSRYKLIQNPFLTQLPAFNQKSDEILQSLSVEKVPQVVPKVELKLTSQDQQAQPLAVGASMPADLPSPSKRKPDLAIGPGGKGFQLLESNNFFSTENKNNAAGNTFSFGRTNEGSLFTKKEQKISEQPPKTEQNKPTGLFGSKPVDSSSFGQTYLNKAATGGGLFSSSQPTSSLFGSNKPQNIFGGNQKTSIFGQGSNNTNSGGLFGQGTSSQTGGLFSQGPTNQATGLFGGPISQTGGLGSSSSLFKQNGSIFCEGGKQGGSLFGAGGSLFGQGNSGAQSGTKQQQDEQGEEEDSGPIEDVEEIDPTKSTGNYDYVQSNVLFKDTAVKFRQGSKQTLENVTVSLETFSEGKATYIFVRLANKCIALSGMLVPKTTSIRILNNSTKNLEISKILCQQKKPPELVLVKIQLKDQAIGSKLKAVVDKVLKDE